MKSSLTSRAAFVGALAVAGIAHAQETGELANPSLSPSIPVAEGAPPSAYTWGGAWVSNHYAGGYGGAMKALNKDNSLWDDGLALRFDVSAGSYAYSAPGFSDKNIGTADIDVMLGYRKRTDSGNFAAYVGPVYLTHDNPDPMASIRGSKTGAALLAEYTVTTNKNLEVYLQGRFATPFSTYSATGRVLYKISDALWFGPQVSVYGNDAPYKELTAGPFLKLNTNFGEVGVTGGYRHPMKSGNADGYFASVYFAIPIR